MILNCERKDAENGPDKILHSGAAMYLALAKELSPENGYPRQVGAERKWETTVPRGWTSGFFPGILWQLYEYTGEPALAEQAKRWTDGLREQTTANTHDVGFMIFNSYGRGYRFGDIDAYKSVTLEAAAHLASRFDPRVGAIRSWDWGSFQYPVIIDNMMNLELLLWAAKNGGDPQYADIARSHANTTIRDHIREDASTFHVVDYHPETGDVIWKGTHQGMSDSSFWARGQAWGIYGFSVTYRETGEAVYLETATKLADRFLEKLPPDGIPYWDFDPPQSQDTPKDASAAAIAACGMLNLANLIEDSEESEKYRSAAKQLISHLSTPEYSAEAAGLPALLLHSTGNMPAGTEIDVPIIYGDYYYIEALRMLMSDASGYNK